MAAVQFVNGATLTIKISDGTYNVPIGALALSGINRSMVSITGNESSPQNVVLNFTGPFVSNSSGILITNGAILGYLSGVTLNAAQNVGPYQGGYAGTMAWDSSKYSKGVGVWGEGFLTVQDIHVFGFTYSVYVGASSNLFLGNSTLSTSQTAIQLDYGSAVFASNVTIVNVSSIGVIGDHGSTGYFKNLTETDCIGGYTGLNASNSDITGSITGTSSGGQGNGIYLESGASAAVQNLSISNFGEQGIYTSIASSIRIGTGVTITGNGANGILTLGGHVNSDQVTIRNNGQYGVAAQSSGVAIVRGSVSTITGNSMGQWNAGSGMSNYASGSVGTGMAGYVMITP